MLLWIFYNLHCDQIIHTCRIISSIFYCASISKGLTLRSVYHIQSPYRIRKEKRGSTLNKQKSVCFKLKVRINISTDYRLIHILSKYQNQKRTFHDKTNSSTNREINNQYPSIGKHVILVNFCHLTCGSWS